MKQFNLAISLITLCLASTVHAKCVQNNNTVTFTGLDDANGTIYASLRDSNNKCNCTEVRFKPENTNTEMALSILLTAKISKTKVRVDFLEENSCNTAYRIYLE